jgi:uncharacterized membrane protein (Fun14 family)
MKHKNSSQMLLYIGGGALCGLVGGYLINSFLQWALMIVAPLVGAYIGLRAFQQKGE